MSEDAMIRRRAKCEECPYGDKKPSQRTRDELAFARCTPPEHFPCHMEDIFGDSETMCRGHWEMHAAAAKKGIAADESAEERVMAMYEESEADDDMFTDPDGNLDFGGEDGEGW